MERGVGVEKGGEGSGREGGRKRLIGVGGVGEI